MAPFLPPGPGGEPYALRVPLIVERPEAIAGHIGSGDIFVLHERPAPAGSLVAIEFVTADGKLLSRVAARVTDTPTAAGATGPGMSLEVVTLDRVAKSVLEATTSYADRGAHPQPGVEHLHSFFDGEDEGPIVGIDLGTTNSCVAVVQRGEPSVITSPAGYETVPSVIYVTKERKVLVGNRAVEKMAMDPSRAVYGSKRFMGRPFTAREIQAYGHFFHYGLAPDKRGQVAARIGNLVVSLETVAAYVLAHVRKMAEARLGRKVTRAVVTVPAYFGETQRRAVAHAGSLAGLKIERILNEPTAGAVAYGYGKGLQSTILVYDLGGGTFDASVLRVHGDKMEVLATDGGPFLGGNDFDDRLTEYIVTAVERSHRIRVRDDAVAVQRIRVAAEDAKRQLSDATSISIDIPYLATTASGPVNVNLTLEREVLDSLTEDLVTRTLMIVQSVLDAAGVKAAQLDDVIMIGGQSRSPMIRQRLFERFGKQPTRRVHPDQAVAMGAALVGGASSENVALELTDILPATIRMGLPDGSTSVLIPRGQPLPAMTEIEVEPDRTGIDVYCVALYRGEGESARDNEPLGAVQLDHASPSPDAKALVTVIINAQGLLSVNAQHPETGKEIELEISLLDDDQVAIAAAAEPPASGQYLDF